MLQSFPLEDDSIVKVSCSRLVRNRAATQIAFEFFISTLLKFHGNKFQSSGAYKLKTKLQCIR